MSKRETIPAMKIIVPVLAAIVWLLLYFTILWRLPFVCNLNRVKIPDGCKEIETDVVWSDLEIMHIKAERVFSSKSSREQLEDFINKNNSHLGRITFGWWSCPEYDHADAVSPEDHPELPWDGTETYYVLTYSTWGTSIDVIAFLLGGISATLVGILSFFLTGRVMRRKEYNIPLVYLTNEQQASEKGFSIASLVFGICGLFPYVFLVTGMPGMPEMLELPYLFENFLFLSGACSMFFSPVAGMIFGIMGKKKGGKKMADAGIICSFLGLCLIIGMVCVYFLIAD